MSVRTEVLRPGGCGFLRERPVVRWLALLSVLLVLPLVAACGNGPPVPTVQVISASGRCVPQTLTLQQGVTVRISFLNQDASGDQWDLYLNVPTKERAGTPDAEPTLHLSARAQQRVSGQITPRKTGQFSYTCVTESRNYIVRPGLIHVVD